MGQGVATPPPGAGPQPPSPQALTPADGEPHNRSCRGKLDHGGATVPHGPGSRAPQGDQFFETLQRARNGDGEALDAFLAQARVYLGRLLGARLRGGWTSSWVEDVTQEALAHVHAGHFSCHATCSAEVVAWVRAIGRRAALDLLRVEYRWHQAVEVEIGQAPASVEAEHAGPTPLERLLRRRLSRLDPLQHELLWMRFAQDASWAEIASTLDATAAGAKRRYQRLAQRLRYGETHSPK